TAANLLNDCYDHRRELDTQVIPTSGAIVRGWISERQAFRAATGCLAVGVVCGLFLVWKTGWVVLLLGGVGTLIAIGYTRTGFCFKYAGLGDLSIFLAFGVLPTFGAYWVQSGHFSWLPIIWSIPVSAYTVGILHANNWRDLNTDPDKGCRTFASMLGETKSAAYYRVLIIGPILMTLGLCALAFVPGTPAGLAPVTCAIVLLSAPLAFKLIRIDRTHNAGAFVMLDGKTAQIQLLFGILLPVAFISARWLGQ
ncbi:MAG: prenyltransferase, partial [Chloroflexota bacterium]